MNSRFAAAFVRGGQHGRKRFDLAGADVARMQRRAIFVIKQMKKLAAVQVNLFSTEAIVQLPNSLYDLTLKLN
jgi:hypothetical protein